MERQEETAKSCRALKTVLQGGEMDVKKLKKLLLFACNTAVEYDVQLMY